MMKPQQIFAILILVLLPFHLFSQEEEIEFDWTFEVRIEQHGEIVPIKNHSVNLDAAPFAIIFVMSEPYGVLINGSFDKTSYKLAGDPDIGRYSIPGLKGTGMAERLENPNKEIMIKDSAPSYWFYDPGAGQHRFDKVTAEGSEIHCRREIERVFDLNTGDIIKTGELSKPLYLVMVAKNQNNPTPQYQRDYLQLKFK